MSALESSPEFLAYLKTLPAHSLFWVQHPGLGFVFLVLMSWAAMFAIFATFAFLALNNSKDYLSLLIWLLCIAPFSISFYYFCNLSAFSIQQVEQKLIDPTAVSLVGNLFQNEHLVLNIKPDSPEMMKLTKMATIAYLNNKGYSTSEENGKIKADIKDPNQKSKNAMLILMAMVVLFVVFALVNFISEIKRQNLAE